MSIGTSKKRHLMRNDLGIYETQYLVHGNVLSRFATSHLLALAIRVSKGVVHSVLHNQVQHMSFHTIARAQAVCHSIEQVILRIMVIAPHDPVQAFHLFHEVILVILHARQDLGLANQLQDSHDQSLLIFRSNDPGI